MPTAQKDGGKDRRPDHYVGILGHKKDSELETAILRVKATDQIGLRFGHVERQTIGLGKKGNEKDQGRDRLDDKKPALTMLGMHDPNQTKRGVFRTRSAHPKKDWQEGQTHSQFVGDHLGRRTNSSKKGVLAVG